LASAAANNEDAGNDEQNSWRLKISTYNIHTEKSTSGVVYSNSSVQGVYNVEIWYGQRLGDRKRDVGANVQMHGFSIRKLLETIPSLKVTGCSNIFSSRG
jgi:hypothetical protein